MHPQAKSPCLIAPIKVFALASSAAAILALSGWAAFLDGTSCKIKITPDKGEKAFDDTLKFADDKFSSAHFSSRGFKPAPYRGEKEEKEAEFEAEQTSDTDGVLNWQGEIRGKKVVGRLRWKKKDGADLSFEFEGTTE